VQLTFWLTLAATVLTGLLAGASLDQSIKQLPARHRIGVEAYSLFSRDADLGNGIFFYGALGIGAALMTIAAAAAHLAALPATACVRANIGAALAVLHSLVTTQAAPIVFSQRLVQPDPAALALLFDRFAYWQAVRAGLQVFNFGVLLWTLVAVVRVS
jgi:hypothetical protein